MHGGRKGDRGGSVKTRLIIFGLLAAFLLLGSVFSAHLVPYDPDLQDLANAKAARWLCKDETFIVVSLGTGTSFVLLDGPTSKHLGGSALGGGSLYGLFRLMLPGIDYSQFRSLAAKGSLSNIDLEIRDVSKEALPNLPLDVTATNFGKAKPDSKPEDIAAGLVNLVLQNIGVMAHLAGKGFGIRTFVCIGRMTTLPHVREIFDRLERLYKIHLLIPKDATFMTAIGAALS